MRRAACTVLLCALSFTALGADREVRVAVMSNPNLRLYTGDVVRKDQIIALLFIKEPCELELADRSNWRRYWQYRVGCWAPAVGGHFLTVDAFGQTHSQPIYWEAYPRGLLHEDGTVTITEPNYDSRTFETEFMLKLMRRMQEQMQGEKP